MSFVWGPIAVPSAAAATIVDDDFRPPYGYLDEEDHVGRARWFVEELPITTVDETYYRTRGDMVEEVWFDPLPHPGWNDQQLFPEAFPTASTVSTLTKMQAGSFAGKWVAAIEGYPYILTDATTSQAATAWTGTDWSSSSYVLPNLFVDLHNDQKLDPWNPFTPGGRLTLSVMPDANDTLGKDVAIDGDRTGARTFLSATIDRDDLIMSVRSAGAFASSGEVFIGTECIGFGSRTDTTFNDLDRGKYAPFPARGIDGNGFAQHHRVGPDPNAVNLEPKVSRYQRVPTWVGKWVGLWRHTYDHESGTMNVKSDALLSYAGHIVEVRDNASTNTTNFECEHVLDYVARKKIGEDLLTAKAIEGIFLGQGTQFSLTDFNGATLKTANVLNVVSGGFTNVNNIGEGVYTLEQFYARLNAWLTSEKAAGRIHGVYRVGLAQSNNTRHTTIQVRIDGGVALVVTTDLTMPAEAEEFMGGFSWGSIDVGGGRRRLRMQTASNTQAYFNSSGTPLRNVVDFKQHVEMTDKRGTFIDQGSTTSLKLPSRVAARLNAWLPGVTQNYTGSAGVFEIGGVRVVAAVSGNTLSRIRPLEDQEASDPADFKYTIDDPRGQMEIKQVFMHETALSTFIKRLFYSTGTTHYNDFLYDVFPYALSLAIPSGLLGVDFKTSVESMPMAHAPILIVIDKPMAMTELLGSDLSLRWTFLRWHNSHLQFWGWMTPVPISGAPTLSESNKAGTPGDSDDQRAQMEIGDEWARPVIKVLYNRGADDKYRDSITFEDPTAVDDAGGTGRVQTIKAANVYTQTMAAGASVQELSGHFKAIASMFTRPSRRITRSLDARFWEGYSVGTIVLFRDEFVRSPTTGLRNDQTSYPALIVGHRYSPGGPAPGNAEPNPMFGEVDLMFPSITTTPPLLFSPTAELDDGYGTGGYDAGTKTMTLLESALEQLAGTPGFETQSDASRFQATDKVLITEIDPADSASYLSWSDTVSSVSGNNIVLTTGLAGFDSAKRYRVTYDSYSLVTATQKTAYAYQSDPTTAIVSTDTARPADTYSGGVTRLGIWPPPTFGDNRPTDPVRLPANASYGNAAPLDVGYEADLMILANNLMDYKTAHSTPFIHVETSGATATGTYLLTEIRQVNFGQDAMTASVVRQLAVAPMMKSSDGTSASCRISLTPNKPNGDVVQDADLGTIVTSVTFTTTSTTYATIAEQYLDLAGHLDENGTGYLLIELSVKARTYGLAVCQENARTTP